MGKYYTDIERYEYCRKYKISGKTISEFARENNLNRSTLRDWVEAYNNINGKFINISNMNEEGQIITENDATISMLGEIEKIKKSNHFGRFDHSIVVIEYREVKITTSLEQAEKLLEKIL